MKWKLTYFMQIKLFQIFHSLPGGLVSTWVPGGLVNPWVPRGGMKILKLGNFIKKSDMDKSENDWIVINYSSEGTMIVFIKLYNLN